MNINSIVTKSFTGESATEPVSLTEAKAHLLIADGNTNFDDYITDLIKQCRETIERITGLSLTSKTFTVIADVFEEMLVPFGPVTSFTSAAFKTDLSTYEAQTADSDFEFSDQRFTPYNGYGRWKLIYVAGYSTSTIPQGLKRGLLEEIAFRFENRGDGTEIRANVDPGVSYGAKNLIQNYIQLEWAI